MVSFTLFNASASFNSTVTCALSKSAFTEATPSRPPTDDSIVSTQWLHPMPSTLIISLIVPLLFQSKFSIIYPRSVCQKLCFSIITSLEDQVSLQKKHPHLLDT